MKKALSILLALFLLFSMIPGAFAAEGAAPDSAANIIEVESDSAVVATEGPAGTVGTNELATLEAPAIDEAAEVETVDTAEVVADEFEVEDAPAIVGISAVLPEKEITVIINGEIILFDVAPQIVNDRILVPVRAIFEAMGAEVSWDGDTDTVTAVKGETVVVLTIGDFNPTVNGVAVEIDQCGIIVDSRALAPLRFVGEAFGGTVEWVEEDLTAIITFEVPVEKGRPIGIMSAMDSELALLLETADITETKTIGGMKFHIGTLEGKDVVMVRAGIGKSLAAACTAVLISEFDVSAVIFTGIAGGVGDKVKILDVVIATDMILHDYGMMTADGFVWGAYAGVDQETGAIPVDKELSDKAYTAALMVLGKKSVFRGTIVTGDQFIASDPYVTLLQEKFNALACEMEGASVARVAYEFETPVVVIRCMSDKADGLAHEVIENFGDKAADISASIVIELMKII